MHHVCPIIYFVYGISACYQTKEGVVAMVGPASSTSVKATYPIVAASNIPQLAPFATDPTFSINGGEDFPYLIKVR